MKTYNKEELDSYTLEYNYKDNLLEEMIYADIIDNYLIWFDLIWLFIKISNKYKKDNFKTKYNEFL